MSTSVLGIVVILLCAGLVLTALFGVLYAVGLVSLVQDGFARLSGAAKELPRQRREEALPGTTNADPTSARGATPSSEAMWHQMQGTKKRARRR